MEKFIPYRKLSKKGSDTTTTRKLESSKAYNRKKSQNRKWELPLTCLRLSS